MTDYYAVGIDIGGSKIAAGLVDLSNGEVIERRQVATDRSGGASALAAAADLALALIHEGESRGLAITGIGIGVPELVDTGGIVRSSYNFTWAGTALAERFAAAMPAGTPAATIESDVRAAARAEMLFGAARKYRISAYVTVGTGISYCLCIDGKPYAGAHGYAIHFASTPLSMRCSACGSLQAPVVEGLASGPGLARAFAASTGAPTSSAEQVLAQAASGHPAARAIVDDAARLLGASIGMLINMLDPEAVVIGGGLGTAEGPYWPALVAATRAHIFAEDCREIPILRAALGADAGIVGAAACFL